MTLNLNPHDIDTGKLVSFGKALAQLARSETLPRFHEGVSVDDKGDNGEHDPVTEADRAAEISMRKLIEEHFPDHGISGEEFDLKPSSGRYTWSLDPIDGTRSFICGLPTWTTLIALLDKGHPIVGLIDAPCLGELYVGAPEGSFLERGGATQKLKTSSCSKLSKARLSTTDPNLFTHASADAFEQVRGAAQTVRFGHDGYAYARLAAGTLDLIVECGLKPHDFHAIVPVVRGAGGIVGDWHGGDDIGTGNLIAASTLELYDAAVDLMRAA